MIRKNKCNYWLYTLPILVQALLYGVSRYKAFLHDTTSKEMQSGYETTCSLDIHYRSHTQTDISTVQLLWQWLLQSSYVSTTIWSIVTHSNKQCFIYHSDIRWWQRGGSGDTYPNLICNTATVNLTSSISSYDLMWSHLIMALMASTRDSVYFGSTPLIVVTHLIKPVRTCKHVVVTYWICVN